MSPWWPIRPEPEVLVLTQEHRQERTFCSLTMTQHLQVSLDLIQSLAFWTTPGLFSYVLVLETSPISAQSCDENRIRTYDPTAGDQDPRPEKFITPPNPRSGVQFFSYEEPWSRPQGTLNTSGPDQEVQTDQRGGLKLQHAAGGTVFVFTQDFDYFTELPVSLGSGLKFGTQIQPS